MPKTDDGVPEWALKRADEVSDKIVGHVSYETVVIIAKAFVEFRQELALEQRDR